jgi:hypothetical protein
LGKLTIIRSVSYSPFYYFPLLVARGVIFTTCNVAGRVTYTGSMYRDTFGVLEALRWSWYVRNYAA